MNSCVCVSSHYVSRCVCACVRVHASVLVQSVESARMWHAYSSPGSQAGACVCGVQGYVVANDADFKRCSLLTHQVKRVCSPCLVVTNHSAEQFPQMKE